MRLLVYAGSIHWRCPANVPYVPRPSPSSIFLYHLLLSIRFFTCIPEYHKSSISHTWNITLHVNVDCKNVFHQFPISIRLMDNTNKLVTIYHNHIVIENGNVKKQTNVKNLKKIEKIRKLLNIQKTWTTLNPLRTN